MITGDHYNMDTPFTTVLNCFGNSLAHRIFKCEQTDETEFTIRLSTHPGRIGDAAFRGISAVVGWVVNFIRNNWQTLLAILTGPIGLAFRPNGTFKSANAYPQPTVYEIDGFYSVIEEIKLSDCNPRRANGNAIGNSERLISVDHCDGPTGANPWTNHATFRPSPTATNQMSAYVDIVGSCLLSTSPRPRTRTRTRMPSSA